MYFKQKKRTMHQIKTSSLAMHSQKKFFLDQESLRQLVKAARTNATTSRIIILSILMWWMLETLMDHLMVIVLMVSYIF